jgi:hypothetical protein
MDMLNDMFQRQARRLESQLYQRAQDMRTMEMVQRQAVLARTQVRQLEQQHVEQAARICQGTKSLQRLQEVMRETVASNNAALHLCDALEADASAMRQSLQSIAPEALAQLDLHVADGSRETLAGLRKRAEDLESELTETERSAVQQIGVTPSTAVVLNSDCNPLNDLSAVADFAAKSPAAGLSAPPRCANYQPAMPIHSTSRPPCASAGCNSSSGLTPTAGAGESACRAQGGVAHSEAYSRCGPGGG